MCKPLNKDIVKTLQGTAQSDKGTQQETAGGQDGKGQNNYYMALCHDGKDLVREFIEDC